MKKTLIILLVLMSGYIFAQNTTSIDGVAINDKSIDKIGQAVSDSNLIRPLYTLLVDTVDADSGTVGRYVFDVTAAGYKYFSLDYSIFAETANDSVTFTFWASNDTAANNTSDALWRDISSEVLGTAYLLVIDTTLVGFITHSTPFTKQKAMVRLLYGAGSSSTEDNAVLMKAVETN